MTDQMHWRIFLAQPNTADAEDMMMTWSACDTRQPNCQYFKADKSNISLQIYWRKQVNHWANQQLQNVLRASLKCNTNNDSCNGELWEEKGNMIIVSNHWQSFKLKDSWLPYCMKSRVIVFELEWLPTMIIFMKMCEVSWMDDCVCQLWCQNIQVCLSYHSVILKHVSVAACHACSITWAPWCLGRSNDQWYQSGAFMFQRLSCCQKHVFTMFQAYRTVLGKIFYPKIIILYATVPKKFGKESHPCPRFFLTASDEGEGDSPLMRVTTYLPMRWPENVV